MVDDELGPLVKTYGRNMRRLSSWIFSTSLDLHERGFTYGHARRAFLFADVVSIWSSHVQTLYSGIPTTLRHTYRFEFSSGDLLTLSDNIRDVNEAVDFISARVYELLLPEFEAAIDEGGYAEFGPCAISSADMVCFAERISTADISRVQVNAGRIRVFRKGHDLRAWLAFHSSEVPNLPVFLSLVGRVAPVQW
jgi:Family of unknown function (DUF6585)